MDAVAARVADDCYLRSIGGVTVRLWDCPGVNSDYGRRDDSDRVYYIINSQCALTGTRLTGV